MNGRIDNSFHPFVVVVIVDTADEHIVVDIELLNLGLHGRTEEQMVQFDALFAFRQ